MTWSYVAASNATGGANESYTPEITGVQEHDLVVMTSACKGDGTDETTLGMGAGWTLIAGVPVTATTDAGLYVWYAIAGAEGALPATTITKLTGGATGVHYHRAFAYRSSSGAPTKGAHALAANLAAGSTATLSDGVSSAAAGALIITYATAGGSATFNSVTATDPSALSESNGTAHHTSDPGVDVWRQRVALSSSAGTGYAYSPADTVKTSVGSTGPIVWGKNSSTRKSSILAVSFEEAGGPAPTPPTGTVTISDVTPGTTSALVTYSYSAADQTGFEYRLNGGTAASIGASPATVSGLTASTPYSIEVRAINAAGAGSWSAAYGFTTEAEGPGNLPPSFDGPSIAAISATEGVALSSLDVSSRFSDAESALTFSAVGSWPAGVTVSSAGVISGTPTTAGTYSGLQVRATDAGALTADSNAFSITVAAAALPSTITVTEPLKNNTGTLLANLSGVRVAVLEAATLAGVFETSGLTTNASGNLATISDAAITTGQQYHVVIKLADGSVGITGPITAS